VPSGDRQYSVEACIVSFNSAAVIATALKRLAASIPEATVAIREHGSDQVAFESLHQIAASSPLPIRVELDESNPGFAAGCNALAQQSSASWLLFLNPDAEVLAWPWSPDHPPPRGQVTGPLMLGDGESARQSGVTYGVRDEIKRSWLRAPGPPPTGHGFVSGAALLIDRASFERLGGFDEGYFMYYEDIDFCLRANAIGIGTAIATKWSVEHLGAHATRAHFGQSLQWSYESACRFHAGRGSRLLPYRTYVVADSVLRAGVRLVRRDRAGISAYLQLAKRAATDVMHRGRPGRFLRRGAWRVRPGSAVQRLTSRRCRMPGRRR
jgi:N-acetylglucosaminyl-diphospho-decaprenol L-rhamnosyltransferase